MLLIFQVITGILVQLFNTRCQCTSHSANKLDKLFGRIKTFDLDNRVGSSGFSTFEYPKEDTTHGVGYGVSTGTVFLVHQIKHLWVFVKCCVQKKRGTLTERIYVFWDIRTYTNFISKNY